MQNLSLRKNENAKLKMIMIAIAMLIMRFATIVKTKIG